MHAPIVAVTLALSLGAAIPVQAAAKGSCATKGTVRLSDADSGRTVPVRCGQTIVVSLRALPGGRTSTSTDDRVVRPDGDTAGSPVTGRAEFRFLATKPGKAEIRAFQMLPFALPLGLSNAAGFAWDANVRVSR
jgi:hypothetical protein